MGTGVDATFSALADPARRGVIELLSSRPHRAGELARALRLSPPAMSRHLRLLRTHGLIRAQGLEEDARVRVFHLRRERFRDLEKWLLQVQQFWGDQLEAFQSHLEKRPGERT